MEDTATVTTLPSCDVCKSRGVETPAEYDALTVSGLWGYLCGADFVLCTTHSGRKTGTGIAQKLVTA